MDDENKTLEESIPLYEMAKVSKQDTKLPYNLWIDGSEKNRQNTHNMPRIKVDVGHNQIPILIDRDNPDIPESVKKRQGKQHLERSMP